MGMIFYSLLHGGKPYDENMDYLELALKDRYRPPMDPSWHGGYTQVSHLVLLWDTRKGKRYLGVHRNIQRLSIFGLTMSRPVFIS